MKLCSHRSGLSHRENKIFLNDTVCRITITELGIKEKTENQFPDQSVIDASILNNIPEDFFPAEERDLDATGEDIADVMYTSGSTGVPKGTLIRHRSISRLVLNTNYIDIKDSDKILKTSLISFDASTFKIWDSLLNGTTVYIPNEKTILDLNEVKTLMDEWNISVMFLTTPLFNMRVNMMTEIGQDLFGTLKCLLTGGENILQSHVQ